MSTAMTDAQEAQARQAIGLFELMALNVDDTESRIAGLCQRAMTPFGPIAAVYVLPRFVLLARTTLDRLGLPGVHVISLVNFPYASSGLEIAASEARASVMAGADEVDLVFPFHSLLSGDAQTGMDMVAACRAECGQRTSLTVTLEVSDLRDPQIIRNACRSAITCGADFIKTNTGKLAGSPTPQAVRIMLGAIAEVGGQVGLKCCGGLRTFADARQFLDMALERFGPQWLTPQRVRLTGSSLLDDLLLQLGFQGTGPHRHGY
jgi:deoxyribose-phosphate aldolase